MASFDFNDNEVTIVDDASNRVQLNAQQALDLLRWLFEQQDDLQILLQPVTQPLEGHKAERE